MSTLRQSLETTLEDWKMMQETEGDEGADWAERFELHFYEFIEEFERWFNQLNPQPQSLEELEKMEEVKEIQQLLPDPLQLNFSLEMEEIIDGIETTRVDD